MERNIVYDFKNLSDLKVYTTSLTKEETISVNKLKEILKSKQVEYDEKKFNDFYLLRFLRARKSDLNKTFEMFSNFLKWRKQNNVDEISTVQIENLDKIKVYYPHGFHKTDKQGRPVYIEVIGDLKVDEMFKITTPDKMLIHQIKQYENLLNRIFPICSHIANKHISETFTILDLKKMPAKILNKKVYGFIKLVTAQSQNNYPEVLGQLFIINAGLLFKAAWTIIKAFLDEKTRKKITTFGTDYKKKLFQVVDPINLPKFLGGGCDCQPYGCMLSDAGPWNTGETTISIDPELIKNNMQNKVETDEVEQVEDFVNGENFEEEDKNRVEDLSTKLNDGMDLSNGQKENSRFSNEKNDNDVNYDAAKNI